jgi:hypothetical protein
MPVDNQEGGLRPPTPTFIAGVYNYCDRWCERCKCRSRCRSFAIARRLEVATAQGKSRQELYRVWDEDLTDLPESPLIQVEDVSHASGLDRAAFFRREADQRRRLDLDPLNRAARDCDQQASELAALVRPVIDARADPVLAAALGTIERFVFVASVKTRRALSAGLNATDDQDPDWRAGAESEANGTAKLVRLIVQESRDAWTVLYSAGIASQSSAELIGALTSFDQAIGARFPRAMAFVRAGLDE